MRQAVAVALILGAAAFGQEPVLQRLTIWVDAVKRGSMPVMVRATGALTANMTAELKVAESRIREVMVGQNVSIDTRQGTVSGKVARVDPSAVNGFVTVEARLEGTLPPAPRAGLAVDGTIHITTLNDVVYIGRPVVSKPESEGTLFRLEPDGKHAARVKVHYGRSSVNLIEIRGGLQPGDRVILSDMSAFNAQDRLRLP